MRSIRFVVLMWIIYTLVSVTTAQETVENTELVIPSGADYLTLLDNYLSADEIDTEAIGIILNEIYQMDYLDDSLTAKQVLTRYRQLIEAKANSFYFRTYWLSHFLQLWFRENDVDLSSHENLTVEEFEIAIQAVDFQNDDQAEYILHVTTPLQFESSYFEFAFETYLLAYFDGEQLKVSPTPMGYNLDTEPEWMTTKWSTRYLEDINHDGKIEWVLLGYGHNTGMMAQWRVPIDILSWDGNKWLNYAPLELGLNNDSRDSISLEYTDIDNDNALEILQTTQHVNNWHCHFETVETFDWSADEQSYIVTDKTEIIPDTYGCLWTQAEESMWREEYDTAIPLYKQSIVLAHQDESLYDVELFQYIQGRYVLALMLVGENEQAGIELENLLLQEPETDGIHDMWEVMSTSYQQKYDPFEICLNVYNFFAQYGEYQDKAYVHGYIGLMLVDNELASINDYSPNPLNSGCDIEQMITDLTSYESLMLEQSPLDVFLDKGIPVQQHINFDWNADGIDEWVIWLDSDLPAYFFISDTDNNLFHVSRQVTEWFNEDDIYQFELPDSIGTALAYRTSEYTSDYYTGRCPEKTFGQLNIWRLVDNDLDYIFSSIMCEEWTWDEIISPDAMQIRAWIGNESTGIREPMIFVWHNGISPRYWAEKFVTESAATFADLSPSYEVINEATNLLKQAFINHSDIAEKLIALDETLAQFDMSNIPDDTQIRAGYYRGLALLYLDRPDEALAQFIKVYDSTPDSVWGQLAGLFITEP